MRSAATSWERLVDASSPAPNFKQSRAFVVDLLQGSRATVARTNKHDVMKRRSVNGYKQFVHPGVNEKLLEAAGFRLIDQEDRIASVVFNASGRLRAMLAHRADVEAADGKKAFARQQR